MARLFATASMWLAAWLAWPAVNLALAQGTPPIVYNRFNAVGGVDARLVNPDGSGDQRIGVNLIIAEAPAWSRDGRLIAVRGVRTDAGDQAYPNVFVFRATGAQLQQVTDFVVTQSTFFDPLFKAFSPDGQRLAVVIFERVREGVILAVYRMDGSLEATVAGVPIAGSTGYAHG